MISPEGPMLNLTPGNAGTLGADLGEAPDLPPDADSGQDPAPWVALAIGIPPAPVVIEATPSMAALAAASAGPATDGAPIPGNALPQGGDGLPLAPDGLPPPLEGLPALALPAVSVPGLPGPAAAVVLAQSLPGVANMDPETPGADPTAHLETGDDAATWLLTDASVDVDLSQIEYSRQLLEAAWPQLHSRHSRSAGDSLAADSPWPVLGDLKPAQLPVAGRAVAGPVPTPLAATPDNQAAFDQAVSQRMVWMLRHGKHDAKLEVHPKHLGSIDIKLNVDGDDARLALTAPSHVVRDALEVAVPRLRELLNDAGLNLAHVSVDAGGREQAGHFGNDVASGTGHDDHAETTHAEDPIEPAAALRIDNRIIDTFA